MKPATAKRNRRGITGCLCEGNATGRQRFCGPMPARPAFVMALITLECRTLNRKLVGEQ